MPPVPVIDVAAGDEPGVASALAQPARLALLLASARRAYTAPGVTAADGLSRRWAARTAGPYSGAVAAVAEVMGRRGAFLLNHSYEWGCTSAASADSELGGATLIRTLDWPFDGLGRALIVTRWDAGAGPYLSVTWPGFVGVLTGSARGRFAACINQPPLPLPGWGKAAGWLAARLAVARSAALSPTHLLRLAFDTCRSFGDAVALIRRTPLCVPAIFTVAGPEAGQAAVIERTAAGCFEPAEPVAANHWASRGGPVGRPRNESSLARREAMRELAAAPPDWTLGWLRPPFLQGDTRLAAMANPASGRIAVQGWERSGPATRVLEAG